MGEKLFAGDAISQLGSWGVFVSTDSGATWDTVNTGFPNAAPVYTSVEALTTVNGILLAGTATFGIYRSADSGLNWVAANTGLPNPLPEVIAFAAMGNLVFAGSGGIAARNGLFVSRDRGQTWLADTAFPAYAGYRDVLSLLANDGMLFAGSDTTVFLSRDSGATWTAVHNGMPSYADGFYALAANIGYIFAGTGGSGGDNVFISSNNGTSWTTADSGIVNLSVASLATAGGENLFAGTQQGIFLTTNNGRVWTNITPAQPGPQSANVATVYGRYVYIGTGGAGVWRRPVAELISAVQEPATIPSEQVVLRQNYPNPVNSSTIIEFTLPQPNTVSFKVFNALGGEIATLARGDYAAGAYRANFSCENIHSGVYFYRLIAGKEMRSGTMTVLR